MKRLKGMAWDHPRGVNPMLKASELYHQMHPDVEIQWDARPLIDFEELSVEVMAKTYDVMLIDHPHIGESVGKGVLVPLDKYITQEFLRDQKENTVGLSYESYTWEGHQWALAIDAATQVSAYREDLLRISGLELPKTWDEVFRLADALPEGLKVGIPLNPTHAFSSFVTLTSNISGIQKWDCEKAFDSEAAVQALDILQRLTEVVHEQSLSMDPIQMSDYMSTNNDIVYVPLMYGYVNYALKSAEKLIRFTNIPSTHDTPVGAMLGGVGIAISASSEYLETALDYVTFVSSAEVQKGLYFESGGQPGHREAWMDDKVNEESHYFFKDTFETLSFSCMRPRFSGYVEVQRQGGAIINEFLRNGGGNREVVRRINSLMQKYKNAIN